jgi:catechol 2,3-dioxygenase-like lactoylglutathione lyase family enzyme
MAVSTIVEKNLIERIDFIQFSVSDLNSSRDWYAQHFGFKEDFNNEKLCVPPQPTPTGLPTLLLSASGHQKNWFDNGEQKAARWRIRLLYDFLRSGRQYV